MLRRNINLQQKVTAIFISIFLVFTTAVSAEKIILDRDITSAVESELWSTSRASANNIDINTDDGVVKLSGKVKSILLKDRAAEVASAIVGVKAIVNNIKVTESDLSDKRISKDVDNAWLMDPTTESYELDAKVNNGHVTISGTVESMQESIEATNVAKGVKGVTGVTNNTVVTYKSDRLDGEVASDIKARLANDVKVDDYLIDVTVDDGVVTLDGTVGSLYEKNRAVLDAWVSGTDDVKDQLKIRYWARDKMIRKDTYLNKDPKKIAKAVEAAFNHDTRIKSNHLDVYVSNGTATITGIVDSLKAKKAAEENAENTIGVYNVDNNLKVRPEMIPTDETLETQINSAMVLDPIVESWEIDVNAIGGIVYLNGDVGTWYEKERAENIAESQKGTIAVINSIEYPDNWEYKSDLSIQMDTANELVWSPFVDRNQVEIEVEEGIVTLEGEVDTWQERESAEDNAFDGGAKAVVNNLTVSLD